MADKDFSKIGRAPRAKKPAADFAPKSDPDNKARTTPRPSNIDVDPTTVAVRKSRKAAARQARAGRDANATMDIDEAAAGFLAEALDAPGLGGMMTSEQAEELIIGLLLPSLALRYVFQQDCIPLGRNIMLVGLPGACKTALLADMYRWVALQKGFACHAETENKDSPDLRNSLCWYDPSIIRRIYYKEANCQEEWTEAVIGWMNAADRKFARLQRKKAVKKKKNELAADFRARSAAKVVDDNPGWRWPMIVGVDSITAVSSRATFEGIMDRGHAERAWPVEAMLLSSFVKTLAPMMRSRPIIFASTNHLKPGQDPVTNAPVNNIPGGKAMRFMNTTELLMKLVMPVKTAEYSGNKVRITCLKNSLGETGLGCEVDMKWWWEVDEATGEPVQRTFWDWDAAAIECLLRQKAVSARRWAAVNEVVDLHVPESGKRTCWSRELGIPSSSPVSLREAGQMLEARQDVLDALYKIMHIKHRARFVAGTDYADVEAVQRRAAMAMERVYLPHELSEAGEEAVAGIEDELSAAIRASARKQAQEDAGDDDEDDD